MTQHVFEAAGLGRAPFRIINVEERRGPLQWVDERGITHITGSPGQPMGVCDYCGTGIAECWVIESADRKRFIVGCDCVRKTGDSGLQQSMNRKLTAQRNARADARIAELRRRLEADPVLIDRLRGISSPNLKRPSDNALDWALWMMAHAGRTGCLAVCRFIDRVEKGGVA